MPPLQNIDFNIDFLSNCDFIRILKVTIVCSTFQLMGTLLIDPEPYF